MRERERGREGERERKFDPTQLALGNKLVRFLGILTIHENLHTCEYHLIYSNNPACKWNLGVLCIRKHIIFMMTMITQKHSV